MGMYAGYYRISDAELEQLRQLEERALLERVEKLRKRVIWIRCGTHCILC